jgi:hypothetical protein
LVIRRVAASGDFCLDFSESMAFSSKVDSVAAAGIAASITTRNGFLRSHFIFPPEDLQAVGSPDIAALACEIGKSTI